MEYDRAPKGEEPIDDVLHSSQ